MQSTTGPITVPRHSFRVGKLPRGRVVWVEIELTAERLSVSGHTAHPNAEKSGNWDSAGQIVDDIRECDPGYGWTRERLDALIAVWERWHLNDMRPGCAHQMAAGWDKRPIDPSKPTGAYGRHFPGQRSDSSNLLGWIRPSEHPDGLLTRECPECGHRYGSTWERERIPADVRETVRSWR